MTNRLGRIFLQGAASQASRFCWLPRRVFSLGFILLFFHIWALSLVFWAKPAEALEHFIGEAPEVRLEGEVLHLLLRVSVDDEDGLRIMLRDGSILDFAISVTVERRRTFWKNENLRSLDFHSLIKYDPVSRQYLLITPLDGETIQSGNLRTLLAQSWKRMNFPILEQSLLQEGEDYRVIVSISLQHTELPPWLDRSLVFWSREVVQPETYNLDFSYQNATISR